MTPGTLVATVDLPVGITALLARTSALTEEFGPGLVSIQYDSATLGIFTPGQGIACPTCSQTLDETHVRHPASPER